MGQGPLPFCGDCRPSSCDTAESTESTWPSGDERGVEYLAHDPHGTLTKQQSASSQAWRRYYQGDLKDVSSSSGIQMRHGTGVQTWMTGQIYDGQWSFNLPDGSGALWQSREDWAARPNKKPVYEGEWQAGLRHGQGALRWTQLPRGVTENLDGEALDVPKGVKKIYRGQFSKGHFSGHGWLSTESPTNTVVNGSSSVVRLEPHLMVTFEGLFLCDLEDSLQCLDGDVLMDPDFCNVLQPPHDVALAAYRLAGEDIKQVLSGTAMYSDGSEYIGSFDKGWPQGQGNFTQWECEEEECSDKDPAVSSQPSKRLPQWLRKYTGHFLAGCFDGQGELKTSDGLTYTGSWFGGRRHGDGTQVLSESKSREDGYTSYAGQWLEDCRHGQGSLKLGADGCITYQGFFNKDAREGHGKLLLNGELLYNGNWACNAFYTLAEKPAWLLLAETADRQGQQNGTIYFGQLTPTGQRHGIGSLYSWTAREDPEFWQCVEEGTVFSEHPRSFHSLRHLLYHGQWHHNLEHGEGFQHIVGRGTYEGQFVQGRRHGKGIFATDDKQLMYSPAPGSIGNWEDDQMHGIAIVEDCEVVHSNLIFDRGSCTLKLDITFPSLETRSQTTVAGMQKGGPALKMIVEQVFGQTHEAADVKEEGPLPVGTGGAPALRAPPPGQVQRLPGYGLTPELASLEDISISKCTGQEDCLNGLYVRMWQSEEQAVYRLARAKVERFLFKDEQSGRWIIAPAPPSSSWKSVEQDGNIFVQDAAEDPSAIMNPWQVWRTSNESIIDSLTRAVAASFCRLVIRCVMGLQLSGPPGGACALEPSLFLRCSSELEGRPVYKADRDNYFLYWVASSGQSQPSAGIYKSSAALWLEPGHWVIAPRLDVLPGSPDCLAFAEGGAMAPHQLELSEGRQWQVAFQAPVVDVRPGPVEFRPCPTLRLMAQEWADSDSEGRESLNGFQSD